MRLRLVASALIAPALIAPALIAPALLALGLGAALPGCAHTRAPAQPYVLTEDRVVSVPVRAGKLEQRFAIATGAGLPLISRSLCAQLGCRITGKHTARRASGEAYEIPTTELPALRFGPLRWKGLTVGVLDFAQLALAPSVEGTLSLAAFHGRAFTIDPRSQQLIVESEDGLARRHAAGQSVRVRVERDGPSTIAYLPLTLPSGESIEARIDTQAEGLILDERYREIAQGKPSLDVRVAGEAGLEVRGLPVGFARLAQAGIVGSALLGRFVITFDLPNTALILSPLLPATGGSNLDGGSRPASPGGGKGW